MGDNSHNLKRQYEKINVDHSSVKRNRRSESEEGSKDAVKIVYRNQRGDIRNQKDDHTIRSNRNRRRSRSSSHSRDSHRNSKHSHQSRNYRDSRDCSRESQSSYNYSRSKHSHPSNRDQKHKSSHKASFETSPKFFKKIQGLDALSAQGKQVSDRESGVDTSYQNEINSRFNSTLVKQNVDQSTDSSLFHPFSPPDTQSDLSNTLSANIKEGKRPCLLPEPTPGKSTNVSERKDQKWLKSGILSQRSFSEIKTVGCGQSQVENSLEGITSAKPEKHVDVISSSEVEMLKNQIKELKAYIVKLEETTSTKKENPVDTCQCSKDNAIIALIKENIEKVRIVQENENERLATESKRLEEEKGQQIAEEKRLEEEKIKLSKAKSDLKATLDRGVKMLEGQRVRWQTEAQLKYETEIEQYKRKLEQMEKEHQKKKDEEQQHIQSELVELELRKEMTTKALESEIKIEALEEKLQASSLELEEASRSMKTLEQENLTCREQSNKYKTDIEHLNIRLSIHEKEKEALQREQENLLKEYQSDYKIFLEKKSKFDENQKIRCVFCTKENWVSLSGFLFHVAREHMFEQYKKVETDTETSQVVMLLKILEEKARKEYKEENTSLKNSLIELRCQAEKLDDAKLEKSGAVAKYKKKIDSLESDIESLLSVKAGQEEEIENLVTRNNTLQNQVAGINSAALEAAKADNKEMKNQLNKLSRSLSDATMRIETLERERNALRQRCNLESAEKLELKNKLRDLLTEKDQSQKRLTERERAFNESRSALRSELRSAQDERASMRVKIDGLESRVICLKTEKKGLETQISSLKSENAAIKEFRSDLSSINDIMLEEARNENTSLSASLKTVNEEKSKLQTRMTGLKTTIEELIREVSSLKNEKEADQQKLNNLTELNLGLKRELEKLELRNSELEKNKPEQEYSNFDLGLESLLRAPLDVLSLEIDSIDVLNARSDSNDLSDLFKSPKSQVNSSTYSVEVEEQTTEDVADINKHLQSSADRNLDQNNLTATDSGVHGASCDCIDCDDIDYLHGFIDGQPFGIKEMMESLQDEMKVPPDTKDKSTLVDEVDVLLDSDSDIEQNDDNE